MTVQTLCGESISAYVNDFANTDFVLVNTAFGKSPLSPSLYVKCKWMSSVLTSSLSVRCVKGFCILVFLCCSYLIVTTGGNVCTRVHVCVCVRSNVSWPC